MGRTSRLVDDSFIRIQGPWTHRQVSANGIDMHVVEAGSGPLVLLLHGFPQFWWSFRHQLTALADAGMRPVAVDLRGYAATDKPPRGYDSMTLAADVAGLIRALGEREADIVGHDWGAHLAFTLGAMYPAQVRRIVAMSVPHPLCWPRAILTDSKQRRNSRYIARFQLPWHPERWLVEDDAVNVGRLLHAWGAVGYPDAETEETYRSAMLIRGAPHSSLEWYRWAVRSLPRTDGRRYRAAMRTPIAADLLHLHGAQDGCIRTTTSERSGRWVRGDYRFTVYDDAGHFPHEEIPERVNADIIGWLSRGEAGR